MSNQPPAKPGQTIPQTKPRNADPTHTKHPNFAEMATSEVPSSPAGDVARTPRYELARSAELQSAEEANFRENPFHAVG
jgi:hypothetical protein